MSSFYHKSHEVYHHCHVFRSITFLKIGLFTMQSVTYIENAFFWRPYLHSECESTQILNQSSRITYINYIHIIAELETFPKSVRKSEDKVVRITSFQKAYWMYNLWFCTRGIWKRAHIYLFTYKSFIQFPVP